MTTFHPYDLTRLERAHVRGVVAAIHAEFKQCIAAGRSRSIQDWAALYRYQYRLKPYNFYVHRYLHHVDWRTGTLPADDSFYVTLNEGFDCIK